MSPKPPIAEQPWFIEWQRQFLEGLAASPGFQAGPHDVVFFKALSEGLSRMKEVLEASPPPDKAIRRQRAARVRRRPGRPAKWTLGELTRDMERVAAAWALDDFFMKRYGYTVSDAWQAPPGHPRGRRPLPAGRSGLGEVRRQLDVAASVDPRRADGLPARDLHRAKALLEIIGIGGLGTRPRGAGDV